MCAMRLGPGGTPAAISLDLYRAVNELSRSAEKFTYCGGVLDGYASNLAVPPARRDQFASTLTACRKLVPPSFPPKSKLSVLARRCVSTVSRACSGARRWLGSTGAK
jgi:hypothetical protein